VAGEGRTRRFTRGGYDLGEFKSLLSYNNKETILDCIFVPAQGTFYVLDVLVIRGHPMYDCDTVTRFDWGKQQIAEMRESDGDIQKREWGGRRPNHYAFKPLEHYAADAATIGHVLSEESVFCFNKDTDKPAPLDGILFYHQQLNYMPGHTPLVSWLKGYMVPEMLNIPVGEALMAQKPANYEGMQAEVALFEKNYAQKKEKIKAKEDRRQQERKKRYLNDGNFNRVREFSRPTNNQESLAVEMAEPSAAVVTNTTTN